MELRYGNKANPTVVELTRFQIHETPMFSATGELLYTTVSIEGIGQIKHSKSLEDGPRSD